MNRDYLLSGLVALALAILFPIYWFSGFFAVAETSLLEVFKADVTRLSAIDGLFVLIGVMEVYLFLSLRRLQLQQLQGSVAAALALCMALAVAVFTATILFDVYLALAPGLSDSAQASVVLTAGVVTLGLSVLVGLVGLALSIAMLFQPNEGTVVLKLFAVVLLICSLMTITILLAPLVYLLYPLALVLLATYFLRGGGEVEVV